MGPHDPERLRNGCPNCSDVCECGVSLCINPAHQQWFCECGHDRSDHLFWVIDWYGGPSGLPYVEFGLEHPHGCMQPECDCESLRFLEAYLLTDSELASKLRHMIRELG